MNSIIFVCSIICSEFSIVTYIVDRCKFLIYQDWIILYTTNSHFNQHIHTTIGVGDQENDISLLQNCDIGYAVGNAKE
ncbi:hypothetical protein DW918_12440, partial [Eubacterium ventriosum]